MAPPQHPGTRQDSVPTPCDLLKKVDENFNKGKSREECVFKVSANYMVRYLFHHTLIKFFARLSFKKAASLPAYPPFSPSSPCGHSVLSGKIYELAAVVVIGGLIAADSAAFAAFVGDNKTAFGVGFGGHGVHYAAAVCRAVSRIHVEVEGA